MSEFKCRIQDYDKEIKGHSVKVVEMLADKKICSHCAMHVLAFALSACITQIALENKKDVRDVGDGIFDWIKLCIFTNRVQWISAHLDHSAAGKQH